MDARQLWQAALDHVRARITPASYTTWFKTTVGYEVRDGALTVVVPNGFACEHLRQRFHDLAVAAVHATSGRSLDVSFVVRRLAPPAAASEPGVTVLEPTYAPVAAPARRRSEGARRERRAVLEMPRTARASSRPFIPAAQPPLLPLEARAEPAAASAMRIAPVAHHAAVSAVRWPIVPNSGAVAHDPRETGDPDASGQHRFENFVVGTANRLAYVVAQQVAATPGESYNPLFIYGGTGLGKTHLLLAIAHAARARGLRACYIAAERFTNEMIESIRHQRTEEFRARYRVADVLLVDDIHFIAGKEATEEEFFHTFNDLHNAGRQIVLSSDRPPQAMRHLHDRLRSRFEWGLLADLQPPDAAHRLEILRARVRALRLDIAESALVVLAEMDHASVRELEGALNRVVAYARMLGQEPRPELVARAVAPLRMEAAREISPERIVGTVAEHFGATPAALCGKGRDHASAWPRQVAMYLLREETTASLGQIGQELGGRDHTTVMHGCARVAEALARDEALRRELDGLRAALRRPVSR